MLFTSSSLEDEVSYLIQDTQHLRAHTSVCMYVCMCVRVLVCVCVRMCVLQVCIVYSLNVVSVFASYYST